MLPKRRFSDGAKLAVVIVSFDGTEESGFKGTIIS